MLIRYSHPADVLRPFVEGYVIVDDRDGKLSLSQIRTAPMPFGALSVNFCDRSVDSGGNRHPEIAFLGLQTRARQWVSGASTLFVMVLLTPLGVMRLFPGLGEQTGDTLCDLNTVWNRSQTDAFRVAASLMLDTSNASAAIDNWALSVLTTCEVYKLDLVEALHVYGRPSAAASALGMSLRTFERRFRFELGVTPTELLNLERIQVSLKTAQVPNYSTLDDWFADQSHEIRHWRRYLGTTPGRYRKEGVSLAAHAMERANPNGAAFYL